MLKLPKTQYLEESTSVMVSDILDQTWNIFSKQEIEEQKCVNLNLLEYMAITKVYVNLLKRQTMSHLPLDHIDQRC